MCSMTDSCILTTPVFRLIEEWIDELPFRNVLLAFVIFAGNSNFKGILLN